MLSVLLVNNAQTQTTSPELAKLIRSVPQIKDTSRLIHTLIEEFELGVDSMAAGFASTIDRFEKVRIHNNQEELILIEYNSHDRAMALLPYKHQFIFNIQGELVSGYQAESFRFIQLNSGESPHLLMQNSTAKGNGWHEMYSWHADSLINVFGGFSDYFPKTYDAHDDFGLNQPFELKFSLKDDNNDGRTDLVFSGNIVAYNHPKTPVEFIFLATRRRGLERFIQKENYSKKYAYLIKKKNH